VDGRKRPYLGFGLNCMLYLRPKGIWGFIRCCSTLNEVEIFCIPRNTSALSPALYLCHKITRIVSWRFAPDRGQNSVKDGRLKAFRGGECGQCKWMDIRKIRLGKWPRCWARKLSKFLFASHLIYLVEEKHTEKVGVYT